MEKEQINRQDFVDNAIFDLIQKVNPSDHRIEWNIEMIGEIRDLVQEWLIEKLKVTDEMTFYPYIDTR